MGPTWGPTGPTGPRWAPCWPHELCYLGVVHREIAGENFCHISCYLDKLISTSDRFSVASPMFYKYSKWILVVERYLIDGSYVLFRSHSFVKNPERIPCICDILIDPLFPIICTHTDAHTHIWYKKSFLYDVASITVMCLLYRTILSKPFEQYLLTHNTLIDIAHIRHYGDVVMGAMASQITSPTIVCSTVYSGADQRKHQSSASLAFVPGIHRWQVTSPHKGPVAQKMFPFGDVIIMF